MNFLYPKYLWLCLFLLPYAVLLPFYFRKQVAGLQLLCRYNFSAAMRQSYRYYFILLAFFTALFALALIFALAKPMWGYDSRVGLQAKSLQIVFVLDISRSMLAKDVAPNRLNRAVKLLGELYEIFQDDELGLIVFKGRPQTLVPLSRDRLVFPVLFPQLDTDILQSPGSNLAAAVETAIKQFNAKNNSSQVIILLSDGETLSGRLDSVKQQLDNWPGTLISIGIGTKTGAELFDSEGYLITNDYGEPVHSRLQADILKNLSQRTLGKYYHIQELNLAQKMQTELAPLTRGGQILEYNLHDRYQLFVALALLCFLVIAVLKRFGFTGFYKSRELGMQRSSLHHKKRYL